jgi:hypothetical protein
MSLESMDDLFGITELVKNIEADREAHAHSDELDMDGKKASVVREEKISN